MSRDGVNLQGCRGTMTFGDTLIEVGFSLTCNEYGRTVIEFDPLALDQTTIKLSHLYRAGGRTMEWFTLRGATTDDEYLVSSDSAYLTDCPISSDQTGTWITSRATASELELTRKANQSKSREHLVQYLTIGQQGFQPVQGPTAAGTLRALGGSKIEDFDRITGLVSIENSDIAPESLQTWLTECETTVRSVLDVLSLAQGRLIRWAARPVYRGGELASILLIGPHVTTRPIQPLFWYLNLQPVLDLALTNYTEALKAQTGINVAIEWMLMHPRYSEAQLLCGMTALEHLVSVFVEDTGGNVPRTVFRNEVRPRLEKTLQELRHAFDDRDSETNEVCSGVDNIIQKPGNLNLKPLADNARRMLEEYRVPMDGIESALDVIKVRNDIVHRGLYVRSDESEENLSYHVAVLQELLKRIFMALLKYEGSYQSFLNGPETRHFKRKEPLPEGSILQDVRQS